MLTQSWSVFHEQETKDRWSISIRGVEDGVTPALNQVTLINCTSDDLFEIIDRLWNTRELIKQKEEK